jgi:hypothetical protein
LWNKPTLQSSINDTKERFNINIVNKTRVKTGGEKHSAYRSMKLASQGKTKPTTKANKGALMRWSLEKWINLNALIDKGQKLPCGTKYKGQTEPTVCRPSVKVSKATPTLAKEYTTKQIRKAIEKKKKGERIMWAEL